MLSRPASIWGHVVVLVVLAGGFYALVLYPFELTELVKGALIGFMGSAITWEFGSQTASSTARQQQGATSAGVTAALTQPNGGTDNANP